LSKQNGPEKSVEVVYLTVLNFQEELLSEGLWDFNRMSQPYIRQEILEVAVFIMMFMIQIFSSEILGQKCEIYLFFLRRSLDPFGQSLQPIF
jgi:hypothetical protein